MNVINITYPDVNNGLGFRVTVWVAGCIHHCKGCQNKETWNFNGGREFTDKDKNELFRIISLPYIKGVTFSGGDPLCSYNEILPLMKEIKERFPDKDLWLYTGFTMEEINEKMKDILEYIDYIVDGKYVETMRNTSLPFRGSENQNIWKKKNDVFEIVKNDEFNK